jgi:plastocyanin
MTTRRIWLAATLAATSLVSGGIEVASGSPAPPPRQVIIQNVAFAPADLTVTVGETIEWINKDVVAHTATARNGDWDVTIDAGEKTRVVLKKAGTVEYSCQYHPNMKARLVIKAR